VNDDDDDDDDDDDVVVVMMRKLFNRIRSVSVEVFPGDGRR